MVTNNQLAVATSGACKNIKLAKDATIKAVKIGDGKATAIDAGKVMVGSSLQAQVLKWAKKNIDNEIEQIAKQYPELSNGLYHVIRGDVISNGGLHHYDTMVKYMNSGLLKVHDEASGVLLSPGSLKTAIGNNTKINFIFKGVPVKSAGKSIFPTNWNIENIAEAGKQLFKPENAKTVNGKITEYLTNVTIRGQTIVVKGYPGASTWFPLY